MASIGMALMQGQENANKMARDQIGTIQAMASAAKQADETNAYFDPTNAAIRERELAEKDRKLESLNTLDQYSKEMALDPVAASAKVLKHTTGGDWTITKEGNKYVAQEWINGADGVMRLGSRQLEFDSKEQLANTAMRNLTATTSEILSDFKGKSDAQITSSEKAREKAMEYAAQYEYLKRHELRNNLEKTDLTGKYMLAGKRIDAGSAANVANIEGEYGIGKVRAGHELDMKDLPEFLKSVISHKTGVVYNKKEDTWVVPQRDSSGRVIGTIPLEQADKETQDAFHQEANDILTSTLGSLSTGYGLSGIDGNQAKANRAASKVRAEEGRRQRGSTPPVVGGLPSAVPTNTEDRTKSWFQRNVLREPSTDLNTFDAFN